jgi:hypothetical protein
VELLGASKLKRNEMEEFEVLDLCKYYTAAEVGLCFGLSEGTVRLRMQSGHLKFKKRKQRKGRYRNMILGCVAMEYKREKRRKGYKL